MTSLGSRSDPAPRKPRGADAGMQMSSETETKRRVPRGDVRRRELARVAEEVFLETGFADTTMQMIASRAGASKETLYRHFASKEALFAEIMKERATALAGPGSAFARGQTPRKALGELGLNLLRRKSHGKAPAIFRIVVAATPPHTPLSRRWCSDLQAARARFSSAFPYTCARKRRAVNCAAEGPIKPPGCFLAGSWPTIICWRWSHHPTSRVTDRDCASACARGSGVVFSALRQKE